MAADDSQLQQHHQPSPDEVIQTAVIATGRWLGEADVAVGHLKADSVKDLLKSGLAGVQAVIDNAVNTIDNEIPEQRRQQQQQHQLVFDADQYSADRPDEVLSGTPATPEEMLHRAGSEFGPLSDVQSSDLDEMLSVVRQALMDVRCTLLELSEQDIEELSQASLIVARIALSYAKAAHGQLAHAMHVEVPPPPPPQQQSRKASGKEGGARNGSASPTASQQQAEDEEEASHAADGSYQRQALWQPLAPQLWQQAQGLAEQGKKKPATALALLTAALPFAWMPVVFGAPLLVTDAVVQWGVGTPLGQRADQAAAEALQVAHLWLLLAKVGARQSFRLAKLEFERMGGLPGLADAGVKAVADPVHTAKSLWGWSQMAVGGVKQQVDWFRGMAGMLGNKPQA